METNTKPLSVVEAAEFLGFSKNYVYKLVFQRRLAHFKPTGGKLYFKQSDLEAFVAQGRRAADYELRDKAERQLAKAGPA